MFDLNELPDTDGPSGVFRHFSAARRRGRGKVEGGAAAAPKEEEREHDDGLLGGRVHDEGVDDEVEEGEEEEDVQGEGRGFYLSENSSKIASRLVDDEDVPTKARAEKFLLLDSDWQRFDESEADAENEVTVAALDSRGITGLDTAVSLVMPTEPRAGFGISPGPEKLGQRTETSHKQQLDFTKFNRPPGKWDALVPLKKGIGRLDDELSLDYRRSPGIVWGNKGKRAREESKESPVGAIRPRRYGVPTSLVVSDNEAGPSLSMSLDQSAAAATSKKTPLSAAYRTSSRGRGFERDGSAALSLGEPTRKGFVPTKVLQSQSVRPALGLTSKVISGTTLPSNGKTKTVIGAEDNLDLVNNSDDDLEVHEKKAFNRGDKSVITKEPFWQGKLLVQGFRPADVAAYCSEDVQPASKLRSLPKEITIENLLSIEDFLTAIQGANVIEPLLQIRLQPDAFNNDQSFSFMVTSLNSKKIGGARDRSIATETKLKRHNELHAWRNGPMASAGANNVFVANLKLRQSKESFRGRSAILYLVLGSSYRTISEIDLEIGRTLLDALKCSSFFGDENILFGFLCASENAGRDAGRFADTIRGINSEADEFSSDIERTTTKRDSHRGTPEFHTSNVDVDTDVTVSKSLSYREVPTEVGFVTDGSHDARYSEKGRGRQEEYNSRHNSSLMEIEHYRERDGHRDRDVRYTEDDRDFRSARRYQHRSSERSDLSKPERSKERELERFRERSRRDSQRDSMERSMEWSKGSRDRMKDHDKGRYNDRHWDRQKERERERIGRRRDRSAELDREDMMYALESEKAVSMSRYEESHGHSLQSSRGGERKRSRVGSEDSSILVPNPNGVFSVQPLNEEAKLTKDVVIRVEHLLRKETPLQGEKNVAAEPSSRADGDMFEEKQRNFGNVLRADAGDAGDARRDEPESMTNGELVAGHKHKIIYTRWPSSTHSSNKSTRALSSVSDAIVVNAVALPTDPPLVNEFGARIAKETTSEEGLLDRANPITDVRESGKVSGDEDFLEEPPGYEGRVRGRKDNVPSDHSGGVRGVYRNVGEQGKIEDRVTESSLYVADRGNSDGNIPRGGNQSTSKLVQVENKVHASDIQKPDEKEVNEARESSPRNFVEGAHAIPSTENSKTVVSGADESKGNHESPSPENGLSLSTELRHEIVLEGCNKDTRVWLASKQSASYLSEEFGIRISKVEEVDEIASAKSDARLNTERGPLNMRVSLAAEKSTTTTSEAKWFIDFAADILKALASRGVLAKYLWYQGQVQRYTSDEAPSISVVVKKIKGEDGKNLERIQEGTGVLIGIVHTKKETVDHGRVIGLRLNGTRQKGFQAAITQVENLLSQVAEQFSTGEQATLTSLQDASVSKLKLDFSNHTVRSPGIVTPVQKDISAVYSPASPVTNVSPLESVKCKVDDTSTEVTYSAITTQMAATPPVPVLKAKAPVAPAGEIASPGQQSEDEQPENELTMPDEEAKYSRPLLVSNIPEEASAQMLRKLFEDVLVGNLGHPSDDNLVMEVRLAPEKYSAYVEFASDELLYDVLKLYADNKSVFYDLNLELGPTAILSKSERMFPATHTESTGKGLDYDSGMADALTLRSRHRRDSHKSDQHRNSSLHGDTESDVEAMNDDRQLVVHDGDLRYQRLTPKPLFLTELIRSASARAIYYLFQDIVTKFIHHSVGKYKGRDPVRHVRYIQSRGCAFVDLATSELVDCMIQLHLQKPEVFFHMAMDIGKRPVPLGHGEEEPVIKRPGYSNRSGLVEEFHGYGFQGRRSRGYFRSSTPPLSRENEMAMIDQDYMDDYEEDEDDDRHHSATASRKRRSDPERTVYADRLPENASDSTIRRIFEHVLRDNMTDEMRRNLGDHTISEVRHVPTKFCAFIVFAAEELTRLVLQLYNQDEEIFQSMRLKPHFHSRMEDLYRDDPRDREDGPPHRGPHSGRALSVSSDRRRLRAMEDYHNGYSTSEINDYGHRSTRPSAAHRAVAATAFKEVDRRRSVYVDRVTEKLPEPKMREVFEKALLRHHRRGYGTPLVSQVTFFRDKFSPEKLCAFVELNSEDLVQKLLDIYKDDEEAFSGMRVRPAVKFGN